MTDASIPDYEPLLEAYHQAFAPELEAIIHGLAIRPADRVLEMACGDGAYTRWLTQKLGEEGSVVAVDLLPGYLEKARVKAPDQAGFVAASIDRLPFEDGFFDYAWCAQSLFSLPEPVSAVQKLMRVVRSGGIVGVLEDDTMHQILLPWPVELELAIRQAEWQAHQEESDHPRKFYVGRQLVGVYRQAGLVDVAIRTSAANRLAPLDDDCRAFLVAHLKDLEQSIGDRLKSPHRETFRKLTDPSSPDFLPDQPDLVLTVIDHVVEGRKP